MLKKIFLVSLMGVYEECIVIYGMKYSYDELVNVKKLDFYKNTAEDVHDSYLQDGLHC